MKIIYIAETSITNKSAYTHHVMKMCDAFSQLNHDLILLIPPLIVKSRKFHSLLKQQLISLVEQNQIQVSQLIAL